LIFNSCTLLGYTLWYGYVRQQRLDQKVRKRNGEVGQVETSEKIQKGESKKSIYQRINNSLRRLNESLTGENIIAAIFLDESFDHYLKSGEKIEYILSHNNNPFRGRYLDGRDDVAIGFNPIGAQYLLVTDRRLLFCTGKIWRDTVSSFDYAEIAQVNGNDDILRSTFEFVDDKDNKHLFQTQTTTGSNVLHKLGTKLGSDSFQISEVADYVQERVRSPSGETKEVSARSVATQPESVRAATSNSTEDGPAKTATTTDNKTSVNDNRSGTPADESETEGDGNKSADRIDQYIAEGDEYKEATAARLNEGAYDTAIEQATKAMNAYRGAHELAAENKNVDTEPIESKLDAVAGISRSIHREKIERDLESIASELDDAEAHVEDIAVNTAQETLEELEAMIRSARTAAKENEFDDLEKRARELESRRTELQQMATEERSRDKVPEKIPGAPSITVEYASLTDKVAIGSGGNADVTRAVLSRSDGNIELAIKEPRISGTLHTDTVDRILNEAETWDKLDDHDHIVGVVDYGSTPIPWIAMEYMDGGHLGEKINQMGTRQSLWTAIAITKGVRHAHRRGVAHLDLKPENVLFRSVEDAWGVPKVADWGLSKHLLNHSKSVEGLSPQYAAPEQFDEDFGSANDITDIYQLGAVFYELFTGQPPFEGKPAKVMHKVLHEEPTAPSEIADMPDELDEILLTALAKEKDDRYDDIVYLRDELQELFDKR
jgi:hypothetical protein